MRLVKKFLFIVLLVFTFFLAGCETNEVLEMRKALNDCHIDLLENSDFDHIKTNVKFVDSYNGNFSYEWESDKNGVINGNGEVFRQNEDVKVTIRVKVGNDKVFISKHYILTVLKDETNPNPNPNPDGLTDYEILQKAIDSAKIDLNGNKSTKEITKDVKFINGTLNNVTYEWETSDFFIMTNDGVINRGKYDQDVTITLTAFYKGQSLSKNFYFTILALEVKPSDEYTYDLTGKRSKFKPSDLNSVEEGKFYNNHLDLISYIYHFKHLPENYHTKAIAKSMGWSGNGGNVWSNASLKGHYIGGDTFRNNEGHLPDVGSNTYVELDVNCKGGNRGAHRIVYNRHTMDIYYTSDHYRTFTYMIGKAA